MIAGLTSWVVPICSDEEIAPRDILVDRKPCASDRAVRIVKCSEGDERSGAGAGLLISTIWTCRNHDQWERKRRISGFVVGCLGSSFTGESIASPLM
eukprot:scaffold20531_cov67-Cyclotella_meneghiniana.AAC.8